MANEPITLDLSKSQPLDGNSSATPAATAPVQLDLSKSQPLDAAPAQSQTTQSSHPGIFDLLSGNPQASSEVGEGFIKGAKETVRTVVGAADSAANWINRKLGTSELHVPTPFQGQDLEGKTPLESVGKGAESLTEFLLGDEALKGLSLVDQAKHLGDAGRLLQKSPKLAKAVEIGANALRQGTVGGAQTLAHGGTVGDALTTGAVTGIAGGTLESLGQGVKAVKSFISRGAQTEELGQNLVKGLTQGATTEQVAQTVGKNLDAAEQAMHDTYDKGLKQISAQGASVPVPIADSPLQKTAAELLSDSKVPESMATTLKGVIPDADKIEPFLKQVSTSNETLTWDQMEATRQKIGQTIRKLPWDSPIRPDLIKLRYAIDDTLEKAADNAGNSDLSDQIKSLRGNYAQSKTALEERAITALRDKSPNAVADILLNKESVHNVNTLRRLIGPENMKAVEGSILDKMIQDSSKNGELQGRQLFRKFNALGPDAKQAIWGDRLPQVQQFMEQAGSLQNVVLDKIIAHYAPYAVGGTALYEAREGKFKDAATTIGGGLALAAILKNPAVLEYALKGIRGLQKTVPPAASAIMQPDKPDSAAGATQEGELTSPKPQAAVTPDKSLLKFKASDGRLYNVPASAWDKVLQADPGAKQVQ